MSASDVAITISLWLSIVSVFACVTSVSKGVVILENWRDGQRTMSAAQLFAMSFVTAKIGSIGDQIWWGIAWAFHFLDDPTYQWWFEHGVYANILFRQIFSLIGCHLFVEALVTARPSIDPRFYLLAIRGAYILATVLILLLWFKKWSNSL